MKQKRISNLSDEYINRLSFEMYLRNDLEQNNNKKRKNLYQVINTCLDTRQRCAVVMYYIKKKKMKQIAEYLDVSIPTVSRLLSTSKEIIKTEMELKF